MSRRQYAANWDRRRVSPVRLPLLGIPDLSTIRESVEYGRRPDNSAFQEDDTPLPELVVEREKKRRWNVGDEDDTPEFYDRLGKRMRKYYRAIFNVPKKPRTMKTIATAEVEDQNAVDSDSTDIEDLFLLVPPPDDDVDRELTVEDDQSDQNYDAEAVDSQLTVDNRTNSGSEENSGQTSEKDSRSSTDSGAAGNSAIEDENYSNNNTLEEQEIVSDPEEITKMISEKINKIPADKTASQSTCKLSDTFTEIDGNADRPPSDATTVQLEMHEMRRSSIDTNTTPTEEAGVETALVHDPPKNADRYGNRSPGMDQCSIDTTSTEGGRVETVVVTALVHDPPKQTVRHINTKERDEYEPRANPLFPYKDNKKDVIISENSSSTDDGTSNESASSSFDLDNPRFRNVTVRQHLNVPPASISEESDNFDEAEISYQHTLESNNEATETKKSSQSSSAGDSKSYASRDKTLVTPHLSEKTFESGNDERVAASEDECEVRDDDSSDGNLNVEDQGTGSKRSSPASPARAAKDSTSFARHDKTLVTPHLAEEKVESGDGEPRASQKTVGSDNDERIAASEDEYEVRADDSSDGNLNVEDQGTGSKRSSPASPARDSTSFARRDQTIVTPHLVEENVESGDGEQETVESGNGEQVTISEDEYEVRDDDSSDESHLNEEEADKEADDSTTEGSVTFTPDKDQRLDTILEVPEKDTTDDLYDDLDEQEVEIMRRYAPSDTMESVQLEIIERNAEEHDKATTEPIFQRHSLEPHYEDCKGQDAISSQELQTTVRDDEEEDNNMDTTGRNEESNYQRLEEIDIFKTFVSATLDPIIVKKRAFISTLEEEISAKRTKTGAKDSGFRDENTQTDRNVNDVGIQTNRFDERHRERQNDTSHEYSYGDENMKCYFYFYKSL